MTSRVIANALLRELSFCGEGEPPADPPCAFAFALDFEPECVWPDLAYDTSSPLARYPAEARDEGRALERWLVRTGRPHLTENIMEIVERDMR